MVRSLWGLLVLALSSPAVAEEPYPWLGAWPDAWPETIPLEQRFATPPGYARVQVKAGSFAAFLRGLPIRTDRTQVLAYDGRALSRPSVAVVLLDVGRRDLQQCADSIIRLHAEYLWAAGKADSAQYHFTSGDLTTWKAWRQGERFAVAGSKIRRVRGAKVSGWKAYREWLNEVFRYAGTRSLRLDSEPVGTRPLEAGDLFVQPGGPGHAVLVLDVAANAQGQRIGLVGQGFMPAEDFHVLQSGWGDSAWFVLPGPGEALVTPSWTPFSRELARCFLL